LPTETLELFAKYGGLFGLLLGVLILGMGTAITFLWRHNGHLQKTLLEVQNKRVDEAKEVRAELIGQAEDTNSAMREMASAMHALKDAVFIRR